MRRKQGFCSRFKRKLASKLKFILIWLLILIVFVYAADSQLRPLIKTVARDRAISTSTLKINQTVSNILSEMDISYEDIIEISTDAEGRITAVNSNMVAINSIKFEITARVQQAISNYEQQAVKIPIGTLLGNDFFIGRGPNITVYLDISNNITTVILSEFDEAGINQTHHRVMLEISTKVSALIPWYNTHTEIKTDFMLAETVIVGEVPDSFTNVITNTDDIPEAIENYSE